MSESEIQTDPQAPAWRVVQGHPTPEELAALTVVLAAGAATEDQPRPSRPSGWSAYWRAMRAPLLPGHGAWHGSGRAS